MRNILLETLQDLRYALRQMRKSLFFSVTIILTFAVGIAANSASFSVMDAIVLRPLAVPDLDQVVSVGVQHDTQYPSGVSFPDFMEYRQAHRSFAELAARSEASMTLTGNSHAEQVSATRASANIFSLYRIAPMLGRTFSSDASEADGPDEEVVLTHAFWLTHLGGRPEAVGKPLLLDGKRYTVVGVMPQSFDHVVFTDVWLPLTLLPAQRDDRSSHEYMLTGRLRNGSSVAAASAELNVIAARLAAKYPQTNKGWTVRVRPLVQTINGDLTPTFSGLMMAATLLLMIVVAANISNLQFARTLHRAPELALRCALGSSRARIVRQLLVENVTYSLIGVSAGLLLAKLALHLILVSMPPQISRFLAGWSDIRLSGRTLLFAVSIAVLSGLLAGLAPALIGARANLLDQLKAGSRSASGSVRAHRLRNIFAGAQVMLATVLITGAVMIAASMYSMLHVTSRFDPGHVLTFNVSLPASQYTTSVRKARFLEDSLARLGTLPGVASAQFTSALPYNNRGVWWQDVDIADEPALPGQSRSTQRLTVSPDFTASLPLRLIDGRSLAESDTLDSPLVALVSRSFVHDYFGQIDAVGKRIRLGRGASASPLLTIVGVVDDVVYTWTDQVPKPAVYLSMNQFPPDSGIYVLRGPGDPMALAEAAGATISRLDSTVPIDSIESYGQYLHESLIGLWYVNDQLAVDAGIALFLCALGIFSVMANLVTERTHEIGIRFALGADQWSIIRLVLRRSLLVTGLGLGVGALAAFEVERLLGSILQGVHQLELIILLAALTIVTLISLMAAFLPARRAAAVEPSRALRVT